MIFLPLVTNKTAFQIVDLITPTLKLDDLAAARLLCLLGQTNIFVSNASRNSIIFMQQIT